MQVNFIKHPKDIFQYKKVKFGVRLGKWHKLYRWKLQELEGNKRIALSFPDDVFSTMFLKYVDKMLARGQSITRNK